MKHLAWHLTYDKPPNWAVLSVTLTVPVTIGYYPVLYHHTDGTFVLLCVQSARTTERL